MLEDFGVVLSAAASALALAAATRSVFARLRDRSVRAELEQHGKRLHRLDVRLSALVSELDELLASGIGWEGIGTWPTALKGHLIYLDSIIDEVERTRAELRAIDTTGPADRLRQDLERMTAILHDAAQAYLSGTLDSYIEHEGAPIAPSASGREITPTLTTADARTVERLRAEFTVLMRTVMHRVIDADAAERYNTRWPVARWECERVNAAAAWRSEPSPIRWTDIKEDRPSGATSDGTDD